MNQIIYSIKTDSQYKVLKLEEELFKIKSFLEEKESDDINEEESENKQNKVNIIKYNNKIFRNN